MFDEILRQQILECVRLNPEENPPFVPGVTPVPASGKTVGNAERELMVEASLDCWLTAGRFAARFEAELAAFLNTPHVLTVNSGSSANLAAFAALTSAAWGTRAVKSGDEVITTAAGFPTTIAPILQAGATPVFIDVSTDTWNAAPETVRAAISPRTKAVVLAHTLGMPFDAEAVASLCREYGLWLLEDCCDALGTRWNGRMAGTFGHIATLSFYPAHHITTGEGGAAFTSDPELARLTRTFRDWGRHCHCAPGQDNACGKRFSGQYGQLPIGYDHKYVYTEAGYNLKMTDMSAACGVAQMERLPAFLAARRANYAFLYGLLRDCPYLRLPALPPQASPSWFGFPVLLAEDCPVPRVKILQGLEARRIGTRLLFAGNAARQPFMQGKPFRIAGTLEETDTLMRSAFWLGIWPGLTREMLEYTAGSLRELVTGRGA